VKEWKTFSIPIVPIQFQNRFRGITFSYLGHYIPKSSSGEDFALGILRWEFCAGNFGLGIWAGNCAWEDTKLSRADVCFGKDQMIAEITTKEECDEW
jgi:hypothetical protein